MKKQVLSFVLGMCLMSLFAFNKVTLKNMNYVVQNFTCEAINVEGFYIFVDSKPVKKYRLIGVITSEEFKDKNPKLSQQYTSIRNKFILMAKEQYKGEADGLIFKLCDGCVDKVNIIKFD